jgi:hypothetical protein
MRKQSSKNVRVEPQTDDTSSIVLTNKSNSSAYHCDCHCEPCHEQEQASPVPIALETRNFAGRGVTVDDVELFEEEDIEDGLGSRVEEEAVPERGLVGAEVREKRRGKRTRSKFQRCTTPQSTTSRHRRG